ncbi:hypothetical protein P171DRAFT_487084 [Karstenula rhodostoma CBS 690.94]|uniref:Uncharacterized protein n=1 Tax=Karstenula rhodostoma CBS 690.94 TaxID=1392251 RepID=A0A9P4PFM3_9PLEO|nr:hypothetical protein P171DRAFT_487084 [Karstenula rhodostoma CBS 690.94]
MAYSIAGLKVTTEDPNRCALAGCNEIAKVICRRCMGTPDIELPDNQLLADVAYCSEGHLKQDLPAHMEMCDHRRWVRAIGRISELHYLLLSIDCQRGNLALFDYKLSDDNEGQKREFLYQEREPGEPFCKPEVPEDIKLCAQYLNHCVHSLVLGTSLMAYLSKDGHMRVKERHILVNPHIYVRASHTWTDSEDDNEQVYHSVFFVAPPSATRRQDPFDEDGIILDPSGMQFGFGEIVDTASNYLAKKAQPTSLDPDRYRGRLGDKFKNHLDELVNSSGRALDAVIRTQASLLAVINVLFPELDRIYGFAGLIEADREAWKGFRTRFETLYTQYKETIDGKLDEIDDSHKGEGQKQAAKRRLLNEHAGAAYDMMKALIDDV